MAQAALRFRREVIDDDPPGALLDITLICDLNGDGRPDIIIGGKKGPVNLFWYENPSWVRHDMAGAPNLEAGGVLFDVSGNGRPDLIAGQQFGGKYLYWFECPQDPTQPWPIHVIEDRFEKYHDQTVGDVDGDGKPEIVFPSQGPRILAYYDIPDDPFVSPWPRDNCHIIAEDLEIEGLAVVDIDGDGRNEVIAGPNIFRPGPRADGFWEREPIVEGYVKTRVAVADLDGDGKREVVLAEGESHPGRLVWCGLSDGSVDLLRDDLFHPHSLEVADFNGDGLPDIFVAEMGLGKNPNPRMFIYLNKGGGEFEEVLISEGVATHEAKVADLTGNGLPDIIGKPYQPERRVDVWYNETGM